MVLLVFEAELIGAAAPAAIITGYDRDLLEEPRLARKGLNAALTAFESGGSNTILDVVRRVELRTTSIDRTSFVDTAFLGGMNGEQGEVIMNDQLMAAVPANAEEANAMTIEGCSTTVAALARSPLSKFVSVTVKGHVDTCSEIIQQLALKTPPSFSSGKMSGMVQAFIDRLQWLCSFQRSALQPVFYGAEALKEKSGDLKLLTAAEKDHASLGAEHINLFRLFWWLAEPHMSVDIDFVEALLRERHGLEGGWG